MKSPILSKKLLPVWSSQHGATITLLICWLIPVLLSHTFVLSQLIALGFLLSGFLLMDLSLYRYKRGRWREIREKIWGLIYFVLFLVFGLLVALYNPIFKDIFPFLAIGGCTYLVLVFYNKEDFIFTITLTFSLFALAGLLAFPAYQYPDSKTMVMLWLIESIYFGLSSFLVKFRVGKVDTYTIIVCLFISLIGLAILLPAGTFKYAIIILLGIKIIIPVIAQEKFKKLKIKRIGLIEFLTSMIFLILVTVFFK